MRISDWSSDVCSSDLLTLAASPAVAMHIHLPPFHFVYRQMFFLLPTTATMIGVSLLNVRQVRRLAAILFLISFSLMALTLLIGPEVKGAHRWLQIEFGRASCRERVCPYV